jgi:hypothetical protein
LLGLRAFFKQRIKIRKKRQDNKKDKDVTKATDGYANDTIKKNTKQ